MKVTKKQKFSFKYQFKQICSKNRSKNDLKALKWSVHLDNEEKYVEESSQQIYKNGLK